MNVTPDTTAPLGGKHSYVFDAPSGTPRTAQEIATDTELISNEEKRRRFAEVAGEFELAALRDEVDRLNASLKTEQANNTYKIKEAAALRAELAKATGWAKVCELLKESANKENDQLRAEVERLKQSVPAPISNYIEQVEYWKDQWNKQTANYDQLRAELAIRCEEIIALRREDKSAITAATTEQVKDTERLATPKYIEIAARAIWEQHMNKLDKVDQTDWENAAPLGRGITLAYAKNALLAIDAALAQETKL